MSEPSKPSKVMSEDEWDLACQQDAELYHLRKRENERTWARARERVADFSATNKEADRFRSSNNAVEAALSLMSQLQRQEVPTPRCYPTESGGVQLEWDAVEVTIGNGGELTAYDFGEGSDPLAKAVAECVVLAVASMGGTVETS